MTTRDPGPGPRPDQDDGGEAVRSRWRAHLDALPPAERAELEAELDRLMDALAALLRDAYTNLQEQEAAAAAPDADKDAGRPASGADRPREPP